MGSAIYWLMTLESGAHERRLAIGTVAQQGTQAVIYLSSLAVITVLARELSLDAFGTYALFVSFSVYLLFAQGSIEGAAVKMFASDPDPVARERVFSTAVVLYLAAGAIAGVFLLACALALPGLLDVPDELRSDARLGTALTGLAAFAGWPLRACRDTLRALQLFRRVALADAIGYLTMAGLSIGLALAGAPLWLLIALGGSVPLFVGLASVVIFGWTRLSLRARRRSLERRTVFEFVRMAGHLLAVGAADLVIYSLDRVVLASFRSTAVVGLYEGPVRAHNLVRLTSGTLAFAVLPAASEYQAKGDVTRSRDLMVRGTRYVTALVVPITIVIVLLSTEILTVWLGPDFAEAGTAMAIFVGYWLVNVNSVVPGGMLVAYGETAWLARYAWAVALVSLALSIALAPELGLDGVVLGTTLPYVLSFPVLMRFALRKLPFSLADVARRAWLPAYSLGAVLAGAILVVRETVALDSLLPVLAVCAGALLAYWAAYYALWLDRAERGLIRDVARGMFRA